MPILSLDDYLSTHPQPHGDSYLRRLASDNRKEKLLHTGMIKWNDSEAHNWAGPFGGNYAFIRITDHSLVYGLKTFMEHHVHGIAYVTYSIYNFPYRLQNTFDMTCKVGEQICSRSTLTHRERLQLIEMMTEEETDAYLVNIRDKVDHWDRDIPTQAHVERPFHIYMCGNDDCSYSATFASQEDVEEAFEDIVENPTFDTLRKLNFLFTN